MATAAATRIENPEATVSQSQPSVPKATTVSASSTSPHPPENPSSAVGGETKVPDDCTSSDGSAALLTEVQKKIRRSERFGVPVQLSEGDKRNSRAERFGSEVGAKGSYALKKSEEQKKAARAERFGLVQSTHDDNEAKKKARHARVAPSSAVDPVEEDKRKARAARFSQNKPTASSSTNGKEQSDVGQ